MGSALRNRSPLPASRRFVIAARALGFLVNVLVSIQLLVNLSSTSQAEARKSLIQNMQSFFSWPVKLLGSYSKSPIALGTHVTDLQRD